MVSLPVLLFSAGAEVIAPEMVATGINQIAIVSAEITAPLHIGISGALNALVSM